MVDGSVVRIVATLAGSTVIIANAPCRGVFAMNISCLSRIEFGNWNGEASLDRQE